jgi:hypothetical protein
VAQEFLITPWLVQVAPPSAERATTMEYLVVVTVEHSSM